MNRTDCHRPSVINPADYRYVAQEYCRMDSFEECNYLTRQREIIAADMARTGGTYSSHEHGGNCACCGSVNAVYTVLFHHAPSNTYVRFGETCAIKMQMGNEQAFRSIKAAVKDAREAAAGKRKARETLASAGMTKAWDLSQVRYEGPDQWAHFTLCDIIGKLVRWGSIPEKQMAFLGKLVERIENAEDIEAKRAAEKAAAADAPSGRRGFMVEVLTVKEQESDFGTQLKMLVKHATGWTAWGTCPRDCYSVERGQQIELTATFQPARDDAKHAFFKRPIARLIEEAVA